MLKYFLETVTILDPVKRNWTVIISLTPPGEARQGGAARWDGQPEREQPALAGGESYSQWAAAQVQRAFHQHQQDRKWPRGAVHNTWNSVQEGVISTCRRRRRVCDSGQRDGECERNILLAVPAQYPWFLAHTGAAEVTMMSPHSASTGLP